MFPPVSRPFRIRVAGSDESLVPQLATNTTEVDHPLEITAVSASGPDPGRDSVDPPDCVVVDCETIEIPVEDVHSTFVPVDSDVPLFLLTATDHETAVRTASETNATDVFPRSLVWSTPGLLLARIVDRIDRRFTHHSCRELYDGIAGIVTLHDPDTGRLLHANQRLCELLGYDRADLLETGIEAFTADVPGQGHDHAVELLTSVQNSPDPLEIEWPLEATDGTIHWAEFQLTTVRIGARDVVLAASTDIGERRELERAYRDVFDNVSDGLVIHDPETGEILDVNDRFCEMNGYRREELLSETIDIVTAPDHAFEQATERIEAAMEEGPQLFEWRNERADGETFPVEVHLTVVDIHGTDRVLASVRDITTRKQRERAYEEIFNKVNDAISVHDPETGRLLEVNDSYTRQFGYDQAEILDLGIEGLSVTERGYTADRAEEIIQRVATTGEPETVEWLAEDATGEQRWFEVNTRPARIGGELRVLGISRDITERKRREQEYEQIFNGVNDAITIHDPETAEMLEVNDTFCELVGHDRETLLEMDIGEFSRTDLGYTTERGRRFIRTVLETDDSDQTEWAIETADGDTRWLEVHGTTAEIGGERRFVAIDRDITEAKRREQEYEQIFNSVNDSIVVHDLETGEMIDANETFCEMVGYDRDTVLEMGTPGLSVQAEGYTPERARRIIDRVAEEGSVEPFEWKVETRTGDHRLLEVTATRAEIGGEPRHVSLMRDITERRQRQREYEQIFNSVNDAIAVFHPETAEILDVNETYHELLGYDDIETIQELGIEGLSAADEGYTGDRGRQLIREVARTGEPKTVEWLGETKDGGRIWLEATLAPAEVGGETRVLSIQRDVTERRRAERRLRAILDRTDEAIYLTRARQITRGTPDLDYLSAGHEEIWGQTRAEIHDQHEDGIFATIHPEDRSAHREFVEGIVADIDAGETDDRYSREYRIVRPDDTVRWVHSDYYPLEWEGDAPRLVVVSRDVTARKRRERRMASFEAATDDLTTADSPEEATCTAVDAAAETLDLSVVGVFLYDEDDGVLTPQARTDAVPDVVDDQVIAPDDGPLWDAFARGTVVGPDEKGRSDGGGAVAVRRLTNNVADWRGLPLGNHGVLVVGTLDDTLDSETLQSAHVLAATLEAALNRLHGQRRLANQEERLRTETERAERLDRIARLAQRVESAITEASGLSEVQEAVCDQFSATDPYDVAWIGEVDVGDDQLTARAVAGEPEQYVDRLDLSTTESRADPHPAVEAWNTDTIQVVDSLVADGPSGDWRQHLLTHGYQSVCAVPLTYDGVTHGVLSLAATTPRAFEERARGVLEQLGTSIGHALAAIERRRALESDSTVELEFEGDGTALAFARLARQTGCQVRHDRTVRRRYGDVSVYFALSGDVPEDAPVTAQEVFSGEVDTVRHESDALLLEVTTDSWFGSPLAEYGAVLRRAEATADSTTLVLELPARADVRSFTDRLSELAPSLNLTAKRQHRGHERTTAELRNRIENRLTDRQLEALETAFEAGYFEWPRESSGSDVADQLEITQPTFNRHLRLAERKTFDALLAGTE